MATRWRLFGQNYNKNTRLHKKPDYVAHLYTSIKNSLQIMQMSKYAREDPGNFPLKNKKVSLCRDNFYLSNKNSSHTFIYVH